MWLDVFKWPEMIKYKKERDDQFAGTEGMFDPNRFLLTIKVNFKDSLSSCNLLAEGLSRGESGRSKRMKVDGLSKTGRS